MQTNGDTMEDRRRFDRYAVDVPVRIESLDQQSQGEWIEVTAGNLSAGGIFFYSDEFLRPKSLVKVEVLLSFDELQTLADPDGTLVISVTGLVQRSDAGGTAICFRDDYDTTSLPGFMQIHESAERSH